jgi:radical SAM protein with 4Fe4S-binding SPASM domain
MAARLLFQQRVSLKFDQLDFDHCGSSIPKRLNLLIQGLQLMTRPLRRIGIPPILQIEPSNICNLRCLTCPTGAGLMDRPPARMPFEMFRSIIDQVKGSVYLVVLWSWGEPFANTDAFRMIRYAKDSGLLVHTSSNGHFFDCPESARKVIDSGLDSLIIAVDGLDQQTYEKYRKGGELKTVIRSIENLVKERASLGTDHPRITLRFIVMKHNEHQVDEVQRFAEGLGVDLVSFRSAVLRRSDIRLDERLTPLSTEYQRFSYDRSPSDAGSGNYCHRPYANLTIFGNGDVVACENDFNSTVPLGNVSRSSVRAILSSGASKEFLARFKKDLDHFSFCTDCENRHMRGHSANVRTVILNRKSREEKT